MAPTSQAQRAIPPWIRWGLALAVTGSLGCGKGSNGSSLDGITCASPVTEVDDAAALTDALTAAEPGDCVVLAGGTFSGSFAVGEGVTLVGGKDKTSILTGTGSEEAVVMLVGEGSALGHVEIDGAHLLGLLVDTPKAVVSDVRITDADWAGAGIRCQDAGCFFEAMAIDLTDLMISSCGSGLVIAGGRVNLLNVDVSDNTSDSLAGGAGIVIADGAEVSIIDSQVANNIGGLLVDGADTSVSLLDVEVSGNRDRGVWAQGMRGSLTSPGLSIAGSDTRIATNGITGIGLFDAVGVVLSDFEISATVAKEVSITVSDSAFIGDGIGIFESTSNVTVSGVNLAGNGRAQALVHNGGAGIEFATTNQVDDTGGLYKIVVQQTAGTVTAPTADITEVGSDLPVAASRQPVPGLGL